jgi:tetratricopeptide (TPR) repeat protein
VYARGTACYRAPELVKEFPFFSNKVDIFAIGCILFELVTNGNKAFANDFYIHEYTARSSQLKISFVNIDDSWKHELESVIHKMLAVDRTDRPSAVHLRSQFSRNRSISLGNLFMDNKDYPTAITAYQLAIQEGSVDASVRKRLGDAYRATGFYKEAIAAYSSAVEGGFNGNGVLLALGHVQCANHEYANAITTYKEALNKDPSSPVLLMHIGDAYFSVAKYQDAIHSFKKALKKARNASILERLGNAYFDKGDLDKALNTYQEAVKIIPAGSPTGSLHAAISRVYLAKRNRMAPMGKDANFTAHGQMYTPTTIVKPAANRKLRIDTSDRLIGKFRISSGGTETSPCFSQALPTVNPMSAVPDSPSVSRRPRVRKITPVKASFGASRQSSPASGYSPLSDREMSMAKLESPNISIAKRQSRVDKVIDEYSQMPITTNTLVAALKGAQFNDLHVTYGDVVQVKEIYEDGWAVGVKTNTNICDNHFTVASVILEEPPLLFREESPELSRAFDSPYSAATEDSTWGEITPVHRFHLGYFCHSDAWTQVYSYQLDVVADRKIEGRVEDSLNIESRSPSQTPRVNNRSRRKLGLI